MAREERTDEEDLAAKAADLAAEVMATLVVRYRGGDRRGLRFDAVCVAAVEEAVAEEEEAIDRSKGLRPRATQEDKGGAPNKLSKIKVVRLSIARVLTVTSQKQKTALREVYKKKGH
ncbi:hypothetical protein GW17_00049102 [Ensete ventricosum]|nr:hypothetical protein GW17_00049102 [Ensete ventricosum]RZR91843.1 hypothetical protein BHM03_00020032 [Ensete ventricosum]